MAGAKRNMAFFALVYAVILPWLCTCSSLNESKMLHDNLLKGYNKDLRPVFNQAHTVRVNIGFHLLSISSLDEVTGAFTFVGMFDLVWRDESMQWYPDWYGGAISVPIAQDKVWVPDIVLLSVADEVRIIGRNDDLKIIYYADGTATFWPYERIESSCSVNVRKYPFDTQQCEVIFSTLGYLPSEVELQSSNDTFVMKYFKKSPVWAVTNTLIYSLEPDIMVFIVELKRQSDFVVIIVLLPIFLLGFLNVLVFLLVPESGERISYCITVLLAISVFMTIISDTLPKSSDPVPIIAHKLMVDVIISMLIAVVTILNLRLHNREDKKPVPLSLKKMYIRLCCWSKKRSEGISKENHSNMEEHSNRSRDCLPGDGKPTSSNINYQRRNEISGNATNVPRANTSLEQEDVSLKETTVSWKNIAIMIDGFAFVFFTFAIMASLLVFLILTTAV